MKAPWITLAVMAAVGLLVSPAGAALLTVQTELASGGSSVTVDHVGQVVNLNVYGYFASADGSYTNDGINTAFGALRSSNGGLLGGMTFSLISPSFTLGTASNSGSVSDMDLDGDKDVGAKDGNLSGAATGFWIGANAPTGQYVFCTDSNRVLIGTATFTVDAGAVVGQSTIANWTWRQKLSGTGTNNQVYTMDGASHVVKGNDATLGVDLGTTITFVPEPATMTLLGLGSLVSLFIRRRRSA
jgi:hypothetical protein